MLVSDAVAPVRRLAVVGLAKNTGKTVALATMLRELEASGRVVGVTSIGNDGEAHDAIDERIAKPAIRLAAGSLVATTDLLLRRASVDVELLRPTPFRTPLGRVVIGRLQAAGALEVAGPVAAEDVGAVAEELIALGASRVLIDGALDRRASASPAVADGVLVATGAVLGADMEEVVARTKDAVDLLRLPAVRDPELLRLARGMRESALLTADAPHAATAPLAATPPASFATPAAYSPIHEAAAAGPAGSSTFASATQRAASRRVGSVALDRKLLLDGPPERVAALLRDRPSASCAVVKGALCEPFLEGVLRAWRGAPFRIVVEDARCVFLTRRNVGFYADRGITIEVLAPIRLAAITVNPVAPLAHAFDSADFRALVGAAAPDVPVFDVMHPSYAG